MFKNGYTIKDIQNITRNPCKYAKNLAFRTNHTVSPDTHNKTTREYKSHLDFSFI